MNVTQLVEQVQDAVYDPTGNRYSLESIVRTADQQMRGLFRTMVEANKEFSNFTMCLQKEDAIEVIDQTWEYRLPTWVSSIVKVWIRDTVGAPTETTFSPYRWSPTGNVRFGLELFKHQGIHRLRWSWEGQHTLRLWNSTDAQELILAVAKLPARLFKCKLATAHTSQDKLYVPGTGLLGSQDIEEGSYINSEWQVTATASTNATHYGDVRRCIYSSAAIILASVRYHELTFDKNWTNILAASDILETMVPIPDEHCRYLVLLTARVLMQKTNSAGLDALTGELVEEGAKFMAYAAGPRDSRGPARFRRRRLVYNNDPERPEWHWGIV